MATENIRGYLVCTVEEASGKTQKDQFVWDVVPGTPFEAFVKVEIRGGPRNVKAQTRKVALNVDTITWREDLQLELLESATELRLMLCREKFMGAKKGTSVIAACGIFVNDILEAVPIDKYFELFKPNAGGEGGFIRISMNFHKQLSDIKKADSSSSQPVGSAFTQQPGATGDIAGRLQGVVRPESVDDVATRVANISQEAAGDATIKPASQKNSKQKGKKLPVKLLLGLLAVGAAAGFIVKKAKKS